MARRTNGGSSVLRVPEVRHLVGAFGISAVGSATVGVAVAFYAYGTSGSLVLTVLVLAANALPALLLAPLVGRLATHQDPRVVEIAGTVAKIVLSLLVAGIAAAGWLSYPMLLLSNVVNGTISALMAPAWPRLVRTTAPEGRLPEVMAALTAASAMAAIAGALLGGVVVSAFGVDWAFVVNAASYPALVLVVARIPHRPHEATAAGRAVREGIALVRGSDVLTRAFVLAVLLSLAAWPVLSVLPAVAKDIDSRAHVLGILVGAFYVGAAAVSWTTQRLTHRHRYSRLLFVGFVGVGLLMAANALLVAWRSPGYDAVAVSVLTLVPIGLAIAFLATLLQSFVQLGAPPDDQAPVLVVYATVTTVVTPIGGIAMGGVADVLSLWGALALSGVAILVLSLGLRRWFDRFDELGTPAAAPAGPTAHHHLGGLFSWDAVHHPVLARRSGAPEAAAPATG